MEISQCIRTHSTNKKLKDKLILSQNLILTQLFGQHNQLNDKNPKDKNNQVCYGLHKSNPKPMNMKQLKKFHLHLGLPWNLNSKP
jgi:hypothetical protein